MLESTLAVREEGPTRSQEAMVRLFLVIYHSP